MADNDAGMPQTTRNPNKRQNNSDGFRGSSTRQKRDKYTSAACNGCKKRKMKCSGGTTCERCRTCNIPCSYAQNNQEFLSQVAVKRIASLESQTAAMQSQIDVLLGNLAESRGIGAISLQGESPGQLLTPQEPLPSTSYRMRCNLQRSLDPKQPKFVGPTSSAFSFSVAKSSLESMGLQTEVINGSGAIDSLAPTPRATPGPEEHEELFVPPCDPLRSIPTDEAYRLLEVYREELGPIYPFIHVEKIAELVPLIFAALTQAQGSAELLADKLSENNIDEKDVRILKMMLASTLVMEGFGQSNLSLQLFESVEYTTSRSSRESEVDLKELQILTLVSIYNFHSDDEVLAWRTIGLAARMCLEMGLHRKESLWQHFPEPEDRVWASQLFWCVYVLDRRWSFGTGMPFALQDPDIDPEVPEPDENVPYLRCLVAYGKICSSVWQAVSGFEAASKGASKDTIAYLDFQIQQWVRSIPIDLQIIHPRMGSDSENQPRTLQRLRVLLYVRANQMRMLIHRKTLLSATGIMANLSEAQLVVDIAKDTICVLAHLNRTSNIYYMQQSAFNYFLVSALAAIFLAVCHAPAQFSLTCRDEFYTSLNLVREFSSRSFSSKRLWKSVRRLKLIAPRLGLVSDEQSTSSNIGNGQIQSSDNNVASAELPQLPNRSMPFPPAAPHWSSFSTADDLNTGTSPPDVFQISHDLTNFFEALGQPEEGLRTGEIEQAGRSQFNYHDDTFSFEGSGEVSRLFQGLL